MILRQISLENLAKTIKNCKDKKTSSWIPLVLGRAQTAFGQWHPKYFRKTPAQVSSCTLETTEHSTVQHQGCFSLRSLFLPSALLDVTYLKPAPERRRESSCQPCKLGWFIFWCNQPQSRNPLSWVRTPATLFNYAIIIFHLIPKSIPVFRII